MTPIFISPPQAVTSMELVKGTRDLLAGDKILRDTLIAKLKNIFERFGYNPIETPALELEETLSSKYAGGAEILKEIYTLTDNADRKLGLRYDLTVPFARVMAMNPNLKRPFKRYQIDRVWRNGPIKIGRYREFYQCDVDVAGISSVVAEAELLKMVETFFTSIDLDVTICVNNKKILDEIMEFCKIDADKTTDAILSLDKLKKIGASGVKKELLDKGFSAKSADELLTICASGKEAISIDELQEKIGETKGIIEIRDLFSYLQDFGVTKAVFEVSLARGLSYYTGTIYEIFLVKSKITSSVSSGGRYDTMIGKFLESKDPIPAVGVSFGLDTICDALTLDGNIAKKDSVCDVYVSALSPLEQVIPIVTQLRDGGVNVDVDYNKRAVSKAFDFAQKLGIPYVIVIGDNEIASGKVSIKDMKTGKQELLTVEEVIKKLK